MIKENEQNDLELLLRKEMKVPFKDKVRNAFSAKQVKGYLLTGAIGFITIYGGFGGTIDAKLLKNEEKRIAQNFSNFQPIYEEFANSNSGEDIDEELRKLGVSVFDEMSLDIEASKYFSDKTELIDLIGEYENIINSNNDVLISNYFDSVSDKLDDLALDGLPAVSYGLSIFMLYNVLSLGGKLVGGIKKPQKDLDNQVNELVKKFNQYGFPKKSSKLGYKTDFDTETFVKMFSDLESTVGFSDGIQKTAEFFYNEYEESNFDDLFAKVETLKEQGESISIDFLKSEKAYSDKKLAISEGVDNYFIYTGSKGVGKFYVGDFIKDDFNQLVDKIDTLGSKEDILDIKSHLIKNCKMEHLEYIRDEVMGLEKVEEPISTKYLTGLINSYATIKD